MLILTDPLLYDEKYLLRQIAEGEEPAFRKLFELYKERLYIFALGLTHSKVDAEEIVQDIFLKLWENRATLTEIDHPQKYIYIMARNRTLDLLTRIGRDQKLIKQVWANISQPENITEDALDERESHRLIKEAVSYLSERKQTIFQLSRYEGLNHEQIAHRLGISVQTVKNTITEVLKYIKNYLAGHSQALAIIFWLKYYGMLF